MGPAGRQEGGNPQADRRARRAGRMEGKAGGCVSNIRFVIMHNNTLEKLCKFLCDFS